jgi:hypothetical protein
VTPAGKGWRLAGLGLVYAARGDVDAAVTTLLG